MLYNAECDSEFPRSVQELVAEIGRREKAKKEEILQSMHNGTTSHKKHIQTLKQSRGTIASQPKLSSGNAAFDAALEEGFARLIADAKERGIVPPNHGKKRKRIEEETGAGTYHAASVATNTLHTQSPSKGSNGTTGTTYSNPPPPVIIPNKEQIQQIKNPYVTSSPSIRGTSFSSTATTSKLQTSRKSSKLSLHRPPQGRTTTARSTSSPFTSSSSASSIIGPWQCNACTYYNKVKTWSSAKCEMCNCPRNAQVGKSTGDARSHGGSGSGGDNGGGGNHIVEIDC